MCYRQFRFASLYERKENHAKEHATEHSVDDHHDVHIRRLSGQHHTDRCANAADDNERSTPVSIGETGHDWTCRWFRSKLTPTDEQASLPTSK